MNLEAELLSGIVQCCLAAQSGRNLSVSDAADLERLMDQLRQSADRLIDHYLEGGHREQARQAYDAGMVAGFYGAESALAWRGDRTVHGEEREAEVPGAMHGLRRRMYGQGYQQGEALRSLVRLSTGA
ncbi:hypothetical protein J2785_007236 [Burkholderia ambifaria]|nr:hypothetical protein [Burkholderia ambifaria]MDR6504042.1 hypothetical protein [Burkholderia ambifaria]